MKTWKKVWLAAGGVALLAGIALFGYQLSRNGVVVVQSGRVLARI